MADQEGMLARHLASNSKEERNRAVKAVTLWLRKRGDKLTPKDFLKLWKGLFYCMWMSDKPFVQVCLRSCPVFIARSGVNKDQSTPSKVLCIRVA